MPHTLMKELADLKPTGMATALSTQMGHPDTDLQGTTGTAGLERATGQGAAQAETAAAESPTKAGSFGP